MGSKSGRTERRALRALAPRLPVIPALLVAAAAWAYPVEMQVHTKGLDVEATPILVEDATVVRLFNHEARAVRCNLVFRNGPEVPTHRRVNVDPGGGRTVRFDPDRAVIKLRVEVRCWLAADAEGAEDRPDPREG